MNHTKDERDRKIRQYISDFEGSNGDTDDDDNNQGDTFIARFGASNFYLNIEPCPSYYGDPKAEAFWTKFAKEEG